MRKLPQFSPPAEAMMAALASRAHEWVYWEIEESFSARRENDRVVVDAIDAVLRVERIGGATSEIRCPRDAESPFEAVDQSLVGIAGSAVRFRARSLDWSASKDSGTPLEFFEVRGPETLQEFVGAALQPVKITRLKNSLGHFVEAPFAS